MLHVSRRSVLAGAAAAAGTILFPSHSRALQDEKKLVKIGRLKQSVCRWCYGKVPDEPFFKAVLEMGLTAVDLLPPKQWESVRDQGLVCSMGSGMGGAKIPDGLNDRGNHDAIVKGIEENVEKAEKAGVPNMIAFFGNRKGRSDEEAIDNCVLGLNRLKPVMEAHKVTLCVELLNSKVDHKDYQGDRSWFAWKIIKAVASPYVKVLYDIYHMQIMEGDVIRTIRENMDSIAHFHTGGVPGRHELDDTQELQWRSVARAIADKGYKGFMAHEFVPTRDPLTSLREAVALCDV
jgi:hydroxypyruvate isomerase